jgi:predicted  nucleic acid-binding Zn-ribbon protein
MVDDCLRINSATTLIYPIQNINLNRKEKAMTENEYNETFDLQMEREHQETVRRMQEFRLIGEQISKMPDTPPKVLEIEVRYLMGIIKELETRIKDLESEVRRLENWISRG